MVKSSGIEVKVVRHDDEHPYRKYALPSEAPDQPGETYIEAVDGDHWAIIVELDPTFHFMRQNGVHISCQFDNQFEQDSFLVAANVQDPSAPLDQRRCLFEQGEWPEEGGWKSAGFVFEPLQIGETVQPTREQVQHDCDVRGRIIVEVRRGNLNSTPSTPWPAETEVGDTVTASRETVEANHVSHAFRHLSIEECEAPVNDWKVQKAVGRAAKIIRCIIRYRSRTALQNILVIPPVDNNDGLAEAALQADGVDPLPVTLRNPPAVSTPKRKKRKQSAITEPASDAAQSSRKRPVVKRELQTDGDDDIRFISAQHRRSSTAPSNGADTLTLAERERRKALIRLRLEELEIQQKTVALRREMLEMD